MFNKEYRYFGPDAQQKQIAREIYEPIADLPLICPHGHVDPRLFSDPDYALGSPVDLLIIPDHYIFRMLYSQGIPLENLGIPQQNGQPSEEDHRRIWQIFADHFYLFRGTPTGIWLNDELTLVFGIQKKLNSETAQDIYSEIETKLASPQFKPRELFKRFNIEVLCTTDAATDTLNHHQIIRNSGWEADIRPTFRPDALVNINTADWCRNIELLSNLTGITIHSFKAFIEALENRRAYFKSMGAVATDHAVLTPFAEKLSEQDADVIFKRALSNDATDIDAIRFTGHMLMEMAQMSIEDGLVMQLHPGSLRNHNRIIFDRFGCDMGADIPLTTEYTKNLRALLNDYGNHPRLTLILFTLDESTYARELAPLAGHYPAVKLGPPWWFHDSLNGMQRFFDQITETAGIYNTVGFNDDTRAFPSIPSRHDVWRRASVNWLAGLVGRGLIDMSEAHEMAIDLSYGLAKKAYKLGD